ncbi:hypothetical protein GCM10011578_053250 [Streptomyces fuscichromogenes]|uniref:Uncharacterized protein n=1 Tax=Streptomyces fuscichromogenes TaxID=1324013 RepID=A0A918CTL5_9ACTN|nr:hypothetical protein GCM10011578_053250 [Streptomyces fuscichromogenes]
MVVFPAHGQASELVEQGGGLPDDVAESERRRAFGNGIPREHPQVVAQDREITTRPGGGEEQAERRWAACTNEGTARTFAGAALPHTDLAPDDVLVDRRAHLMHWSWPTLGTAFIDRRSAPRRGAVTLCYPRIFACSWRSAIPAVRFPLFAGCSFLPGLPRYVPHAEGSP